jgi:hypothetical protein
LRILDKGIGYFPTIRLPDFVLYGEGVTAKRRFVVTKYKKKGGNPQSEPPPD